MSKLLGAASLFLFPLLAVAASEHGHGEVVFDDHWQHLIIAQSFNVILIIIGLVYFLRKPVREFFAAKRNEYLSAAEKTLAAKKLAETELAHMKSELSRVENTAAESIARAKTEAEQLRKTMIADAEAISQRVKADADVTAKAEVEKAKNILRAETIQAAVSAAEKAMSSGVSQEDHLRLNKEFISNIKAVEQ